MIIYKIKRYAKLKAINNLNIILYECITKYIKFE